MPSHRKRYNHTKLGKNLRSLGLLPKGYKLTDLTKNQKDRIVKLAHKFPGPANRPQEFVAKKVSYATARKLRGAGYRVKQNRAVFERHGATKITLSGARVVRESPDGMKRSTIIGGNVFDNAREFFKHKKKGEYLMLRVGDKHEFGVRLYSMEDFEAYMRWMERLTGFSEFRDDLYVVTGEQVKAPVTRARTRKGTYAKSRKA